MAQDNSKYFRALENPISFPGGYTFRFWYSDGSRTCHACEKKAAAEREPGDEVPLADIYWEGPADHCRDCNAELPSEYGEEDRP